MNTDHCYSVFLVDLGQFGDAEWWWGRVREGKEGGRRGARSCNACIIFNYVRLCIVPP